MIFGINEDCIVRTGGHACFAADADRFVEIDDAVQALEHRRGGTGGDARCVCALVAARYLMRASRLWELADVHMFDVSARYRQRNFVFGLAGGRARMAANATRMINDLGPFNVGSLLGHRSLRARRLQARCPRQCFRPNTCLTSGAADYITQEHEENMKEVRRVVTLDCREFAALPPHSPVRLCLTVGAFSNS